MGKEIELLKWKKQHLGQKVWCWKVKKIILKEQNQELIELIAKLCQEKEKFSAESAK